MERNEFGQTEIYQLLYKKKLYCDWTTTCDLLNEKSTNLHRLMSKLSKVQELPTIRYKNRIYYSSEWILTGFWKSVSDAQKAGKL